MPWCKYKYIGRYGPLTKKVAGLRHGDYRSLEITRLAASKTKSIIICSLEWDWPVFGSVCCVEQFSVEGVGDEVGRWRRGRQRRRQRLRPRRGRHRSQPVARGPHPLAFHTRLIQVHHRRRRACWQINLFSVAAKITQITIFT